MASILLNYIYLGQKHAGGKDQLGLNLLRGFQELKIAGSFQVICYDYSVDIIKKLAPDVEIYPIKSSPNRNELHRMLKLCWVNTFLITRIVKQLKPSCLFHLSYNTGLKKMKTKEIVLPADIKAISHRTLGGRTVPLHKYILYKLMYYSDFKKNDSIIAMCRFDQEQIEKYYSNFKKKITLIPVPVNVKLIERQLVEKPYITAINLQFYHKNIITLIKAFEKIRDKIPHNLILIGKLHKRVDFLWEYVKEHQLEDRVYFTGFMEEDAMYQMLTNSSLYVNPSLYEGFGMTAVESMILKVPTLIADVAANYEVTQGQCFYYKPADHVEALAASILEIINDLPDNACLSRISQQITDTYNYKKVSDLYWNFLKNIGEKHENFNHHNYL